MSKSPPVVALPSMDLATMQETIAAKSDEVAAMKAAARAMALAEVQRLVSMYDMEKGEIDFARPKTPEFSDGRTVVKAKFFDPATGTTWSGRGYKPKWLSEYMDRGRSIEEFRIRDGQPRVVEHDVDDESSAPSPGL